MTQLMEYAEYLSKEIGPRPAGTEEEQQAALYITERFQKDSGFSAQIEEFTSSSNIEGISAIPCLIVIVVAILGMIFPMFTIPAFILAAASAALYTLEAFGHPLVTKALARGASQNVVAKYQPNMGKDSSARGRKIILIAHYNSGKVTPGLVRTIESIKLPISIGLLCVAGIVAAAFFLLLHVFINAGVGGIVINVLTVITLIICAYPILRAILYRVAPYNEGANNNASGTAALIEVARRISRGSVSEADLAEKPDIELTIHGEQAARESGLVPEGAQIRYEAEQLVPPEELGEYSDEERLLAAKAAIAAMTGQPVEKRVFGSVASHLVNSRAHDEAPVAHPAASVSEQETPQEEAAPAQTAFAIPASQAVAEQVDQSVEAQPEVASFEEKSQAPADADGYKNAPSWFVAAQQNAKKPAGETGPIQRSRYAEAIEAAEREMAEREREREEFVRMQREAELRAREQAAREAIEQTAQARKAAELAAEPKPVEEPEPQPVEEEADVTRAIEMPAIEEAPAIQVPAIDVEASKDAPAYDEFSESLGSTTVFDPHKLQGEGAEEAAAPARRLDLPSLDATSEPQESKVPETTSPSRSGLFRMLRTDVPSMSGVIRMQEAGQDVSQLPVQTPEPAPEPIPEPVVAAPAPMVPEAPASNADVTEMVDYNLNPAEIIGYDDRYDDEYDDYEDYDDQRFDYQGDYGNFEEYLGEGEGQVEMPETRAGGFLSRFRRKNKAPERLGETPQEWLDVDADFDARTVGRERGGWESFREENYDDNNGAGSRNGRWEGGAFSRVRLGRVDTRSGEDAEADIPEEVIDYEEDRQIADEIEQIYHFRNPLYNTEIWLVALGSENAAHDGVKAFLAEHADELRGSMIIQVESLGAGELCVASAEGRIKPQIASSRVKRYTRSATAATGIAPGSVDLTGEASAASIMQAEGFQAMHLLGVEDGAPALKGSPDDIMENIDDLLLDDNVNFLMELLKK